LLGTRCEIIRVELVQGISAHDVIVCPLRFGGGFENRLIVFEQQIFNPLVPTLNVGGGVFEREIRDARIGALEQRRKFGNQLLKGIRIRPERALQVAV